MSVVYPDSLYFPAPEAKLDFDHLRGPEPVMEKSSVRIADLPPIGSYTQDFNAVDKHKIETAWRSRARAKLRAQAIRDARVSGHAVFQGPAPLVWPAPAVAPPVQPPRAPFPSIYLERYGQVVPETYEEISARWAREIRISWL